ncbi:Protein of unknown function (DUF2867) [Lentzea flava]|nr:Protein of unknown function (DUF2867) [Lentzea flava]
MQVHETVRHRIRVADGERGGSTYRQRAVFVPKGLAGHLYWAVVWPFHGVVFGGMVRNIANEAELHKNFRKS